MKKILIADDDKMIRSILKAKFKSMYECIETEDGKEAISKVIVNKPDLVILDITMPELDGMKVLRRMRSGLVEGLKEIPVIMLTGTSDKATIKTAMNFGISAYFIKPFDLDALMEKVFFVLHRGK